MQGADDLYALLVHKQTNVCIVQYQEQPFLSPIISTTTNLGLDVHPKELLYDTKTHHPNLKFSTNVVP